MLNDNGNVKRWEDIKVEFHLRNTLYCLQNVNALPKTWKDMILKDKGNARNLVLFDHHIVRKFQICSLNKLPSKEVKSYIKLLLTQILLNRQHKIISRIFLNHPSLIGKKYIF